MTPQQIRTAPSIHIATDVTAFNGVELENAAVDPTVEPGDYRFHSHQRGDSDLIAAGANPLPRNLWKSEPISAVVMVPGPPGNDPNHVFQQSLRTTLGYLNSTLWQSTTGWYTG